MKKNNDKLPERGNTKAKRLFLLPGARERVKKKV
jgi:hypothetical protein